MNAPLPSARPHLPLDATDERPWVTLVLPCFNEAALLARHWCEIEAALRALSSEWRFEVILIDDGSRDETAAIASAIEPEEWLLRVIRHPVNFGLGQALKTAFNASRGDVVITMDIDLSYAPELIGRLLEALQTHRAKLVLASAYMPGGQVINVPWHRRVLSRWANRFLSLFAQGGLATLTCMVRAYDGPFIRSLVLRSTGMEIMPELIYKTMVMRGRIVEVPATLDWSRQLELGRSRSSSMRIARQVLSTLVTGVMLRPFAWLMAPGLLLMTLGMGTAALMLWDLALLAASQGAPLADLAPALWRAHPIVGVLGAVSLTAGMSLLGLGLVALQMKRYFEDLYHLGVTLHGAHRGEIRREARWETARPPRSVSRP